MGCTNLFSFKYFIALFIMNRGEITLKKYESKSKVIFDYEDWIFFLNSREIFYIRHARCHSLLHNAMLQSRRKFLAGSCMGDGLGASECKQEPGLRIR